MKWTGLSVRARGSPQFGGFGDTTGLDIIDNMLQELATECYADSDADSASLIA